jgi:hypothetical protein
MRRALLCRRLCLARAAAAADAAAPAPASFAAAALSAAAPRPPGSPLGGALHSLTFSPPPPPLMLPEAVRRGAGGWRGPPPLARALSAAAADAAAAAAAAAGPPTKKEKAGGASAPGSTEALEAAGEGLSDAAILRRLTRYLWPADRPEYRRRVAGALSLLVFSKLMSIQARALPYRPPPLPSLQLQSASPAPADHPPAAALSPLAPRHPGTLSRARRYPSCSSWRWTA